MKRESKNVGKRLQSYIDLTCEALKKAEKALNKDDKENAEIVLDMAQRYYDDALYFREKGMLLTALCAVTYAHGWLDCGSKLGLFKVKDNKLFVVK